MYSVKNTWLSSASPAPDLSVIAAHLLIFTWRLQKQNSGGISSPHDPLLSVHTPARQLMGQQRAALPCSPTNLCNIVTYVWRVAFGYVIVYCLRYFNSPIIWPSLKTYVGFKINRSLKLILCGDLWIIQMNCTVLGTPLDHKNHAKPFDTFSLYWLNWDLQQRINLSSSPVNITDPSLLIADHRFWTSFILEPSPLHDACCWNTIVTLIFGFRSLWSSWHTHTSLTVISHSHSLIIPSQSQ